MGVADYFLEGYFLRLNKKFFRNGMAGLNMNDEVWQCGDCGVWFCNSFKL